jgi:tetratricopeptide (TPR) repeat protein
MSFMALLVLLAWAPVVIVLYALLPGRRAATIAVIGAWLALPPVNLPITGLPDYSKNTAATLGMMLGMLLFDPGRLLKFRPRWFDLPMLLWCTSGIASSLYNGLGIYDGLSNMQTDVVMWGLPYLLGRLYFGDPEGLRAFAVGMVIGGLAYVPPCLFEMRMSPVLMNWIYGMGGFEGYRYGGWRPHVFFSTGLELGMWMTAALLAAWWLWRCGALRRLGQVPFGQVLLPILAVTTIFCRSTGALVLLGLAVPVLWLSTRFRTRLLMVGLLLVGPVYAVTRSTNQWSGQNLVNLAASVTGPERAGSLEYRFKCENLLAVKALQQPIFGWGGFGRSRVSFDSEADRAGLNDVPTDGWWIIVLGNRGAVGLSLFYLALVLPAFLFVWRFPARLWGDPRVAAGSMAAALLGIYMIDCLLNAMVNIIYITLAGGLISLQPRQLATMAARHGTGAAGRRASGAVPPAAAAGDGPTGPRPAHGRVALADRFCTLGRSFKRAGRLDEAEAAWRQALDLLTESIEADPAALEVRRRWCDCANDLAWLRANHPDPALRDPGYAVALARQVVEECPDAPAYWNTLGVAHYRGGDAGSAVAALDRATTLGGGTAFDDVFLAMVHTRLGDVERARQDLARAMIRAERDYPGHPELAGLCDEAHSLIIGSTTATTANH